MPWWGYVVQVGYVLFEHWLGTTNKVNAGSSIELVKNLVTGKQP